MAEWESSYGGCFLSKARLLTKEEIDKRYPIGNNSRMAKLTHEALNNGFDILYGENPNHNLFCHYKNWLHDVLVTAAHLYKTTPDYVKVG